MEDQWWTRCLKFLLNLFPVELASVCVALCVLQDYCQCWVLCKNNECFKLLSHFSSHLILFLILCLLLAPQASKTVPEQNKFSVFK